MRSDLHAGERPRSENHTRHKVNHDHTTLIRAVFGAWMRVVVDDRELLSHRFVEHHHHALMNALQRVPLLLKQTVPIHFAAGELLRIPLQFSRRTLIDG